MIHATLEDGSTMLFDANETVLTRETREWMEGDYIDFDHEGPASDVIKPGAYVLDRGYFEDDVKALSDSKILSVRIV